MSACEAGSPAMTLTRRKFGLLAAGATIGLAAPGLVRAADNTTRIGVLLPLTGPLASLGNDVQRGFMLARDFINAEGGVFGHPVELVTADVPDSTAATSQATRLITSDRVKIIAGSYSSAVSFAASQVAERSRIIYWEEGAVADDITARGFKNLFRMLYRASTLGEDSARFVIERMIPGVGLTLGSAKVALLYENSSYGSAVGERASQRLKERGVQIVDDTSYDFKTNDFSSVVQRYKSLQPDILILCQYSPDAILFWRQAREASLDVKGVIGNGGGHSLPEFAEALGDDVNGVFNLGIAADFNPGGLLPPTRELYDRFHAEHARQFPGHSASAQTGLGFNGLWTLLKEVLPRAGSLEPDKVREAALALDLPVGSSILGWGTKFDPLTHDNMRALPFVEQWQKKELRVVGPAEFAQTKTIVMPLRPWGRRGQIG
jgi:branched-chain amino acid transport system substrate-binding protein